MNVGLFFGSFNPIHTGHLIIAGTVLNNLPLSKIWFVVSPQNPLKENQSLLAADKRLLLVKKAIEDDPRLEVSDVEFSLPIPSYTIDTLDYLEKHNPAHHFYLIMGSDSFSQLHQWKSYEKLLEKNIVVYIRPGYSIPETVPGNITLLKSPLLDISATSIRALIKERKNIKYLVPEKVLQLIEQGKFYR